METLSDAACEVLVAVTANGWSSTAAADALGTVDVLVAALGWLGPDAEEALAPVLSATAAIRVLLSAPPPPSDVAALSKARRRNRPTDRRFREPSYWINRDARVAEQLWVDSQEGRGGELADLFAALPPRDMIEAVDRRSRGEKWHLVLVDLTRRHGA
ncbi:hypothetical protein ACFRR7_36515 [Streptomyces sp. NPDC056909]|uniref:hypothetical protein n=1 Tax=Streptomyces sp. NPDC056909 TaxID=3345963 RepID=UPI00368368FD